MTVKGNNVVDAVIAFILVTAVNAVAMSSVLTVAMLLK